jgi:hypothetical protein
MLVFFVYRDNDTFILYEHECTFYVEVLFMWIRCLCRFGFVMLFLWMWMIIDYVNVDVDVDVDVLFMWMLDVNVLFMWMLMLLFMFGLDFLRCKHRSYVFVLLCPVGPMWPNF